MRIALGLYVLTATITFALGLILRNTVLRAVGAVLLLPAIGLAVLLILVALWNLVAGKSK